MNPKEIRLAAGMSIERAAVAGGVTSPTLRIYEANRESVSRATRAKLDALYSRWNAAPGGHTVEPPPRAA